MWIIVFAFVIAILLLMFFVGVASSSSPPENIAELVDWEAIADEELQSYLPHKKINAIKRYRILASVDLKESKEAVENME